MRVKFACMFKLLMRQRVYDIISNSRDVLYSNVELESEANINRRLENLVVPWLRVQRIENADGISVVGVQSQMFDLSPYVTQLPDLVDCGAYCKSFGIENDF